MQAKLPANCRWIYPRCDSRLPVIAGNFVWKCRYFCLRLCGNYFLSFELFLPEFGGYFYLRLLRFCRQIACITACRSRHFCMLVVGKFAWVPHVKLPVKYPWYSGKFTCACRQFACILREVLAASTQVDLPVFTGKLHVMQVNCSWGFFTCELQVKLLAFAGYFARVSFTMNVPQKFYTSRSCWFSVLRRNNRGFEVMENCFLPFTCKVSLKTIVTILFVFL